MRRIQIIGLWGHLVLVLLFTGRTALAQNEPLIYPGHDQFNADRFIPFTAEYSQMGFPFTIAFEKAQWNESLVYNALMIMEGPNGIGVDQVAHFAEDFRFAFRNFGFGAFGREHIVIENQEDVLHMSRMPLEGDSARTMTYLRKELERPVFDGTLVYWFLAGLPLEKGYEVRMNQWLPEETGITVRPSAAFTVSNREKITTEAGEVFECWVVEAESGPVKYVNYVAQRAPYLIKQVAIQDQQDPIVLLELKRLH